MVSEVARNWKTAGLNSADQALCAFAEKLTLTPEAMSKENIQCLEDLGFSQTAIHDAVQIIGYFNYINRVAVALDVDLENEVRAWEI
ncbi:MAG: hypothetical protein MK515_07810 [SAR324 cluster bacterium]|nr:hypothetical protein [SAR324 cluster bacterium]